MSIPSKIAANFEPHRRPDEHVVASFSATTANQIIVGLGAIVAAVTSATLDAPAINLLLWVLVLVAVIVFFITNKNFTVIATDQRTVIARSTFWSGTKVEEVVSELPPTTQIGPATGLILYPSTSLGRKLYIHRRMFGEVTRADSRPGSTTV